MNKQYLMYALSQLMKKKDNNGVFTIDETGSKWHRETNVDILKTFCSDDTASMVYGYWIACIDEKTLGISEP